MDNCGSQSEFIDQIPLLDFPNFPEDKQISDDEWRKITEKLYGKMFLHEWKKSFENYEILDGKYWELNIKLTGHRVRNYRGSNAYPPYWGELKRLFGKYAKL